MDAYYDNQISVPYYAGAARQRGSGLGSLVTSVGRMAIPLFKNIVFPAAKQFVADVAAESAPELIEVVQGRSTVKRAAKRSLSKAATRTLSRQRGSGGKQSRQDVEKQARKEARRVEKQPLIPPSPPTTKKPSHYTKKSNKPKRSRYDILQNIR